MRLLVLVVIMLGTNISTFGGVNSHGLAVIAAALHATTSSAVELNGHIHEDQSGELALADQSAGADDHPHHGADHSHDTAHALPVIWSLAPPPLSTWWMLVRPWIEMVQTFRLERPPMN